MTPVAEILQTRARVVGLSENISSHFQVLKREILKVANMAWTPNDGTEFGGAGEQLECVTEGSG